MQDRNVEFPNRFRMVKVEGTDDIYDMIPAPGDVLNPGTLLNKANLLTDETARLLGLSQDDPKIDQALRAKFSPVKTASYETAGAYEWTAPDLADGKAYKIGVFIVGAGASGSAGVNSSTSSLLYAYGGASGFSASGIFIVEPGEKYSLVVGAGGESVSTTSSTGPAKSGGTSSFNGLVASGGRGKTGDSFTYGTVLNGGNPSMSGHSGTWGGGILYYNGSIAGRPDMCLNPFEGTRIMGSGGSAQIKKNGDSSGQTNGGKDPITGLGGGNGVFGTSGTTATAESGTTVGSGGGGAAVASSGTAISGAGADGAVYIYFLGVVEE